MTNQPDEERPSEQKVPESKPPRKVAKTFALDISKLTRKVAKTLLESDVSQSELENLQVEPAANEPVQPAVEKANQPIELPAPAIDRAPKEAKRRLKISRTLLEIDFPQELRLNETEPAAPENKPSARPQMVAKTMLDREVLLAAVAKSASRREALIKELIESRPVVAPVEPVKEDKLATPCSWKWTDSDPRGKNRVRHCGDCHKNIYDFQGLGIEDARSLVFKHENLEKFRLYKRADGKFMTSDCAIVLVKRRKMIVVVASALLCVTLGAAIFLLVPHSAQQDVVDDTPAPEFEMTKNERKIAIAKAESLKAKNDGSFYWREGLPPPTMAKKSAEQAATSQTSDDEASTDAPPIAPDPDSEGQSWEY